MNGRPDRHPEGTEETARWWTRVAAFVTLAAAVRLLAPTVADPDLWGHILFGKRTLALGLERTDPFSYLSGNHPWINHEILSEVAFGFMHDLGGGVALIILKTSVALVIVGAIYRHLVTRGADALRAGLLLLPAMALLVPGLASVRPQMFTFLFFTILLLALHGAEHGRERLVWVAPPLLAVWINFHGGVLAGAGILGVWGIARALTALRRANGAREAWHGIRLPLAVGGASALALLANPYGWELPAFLFRTATVPRPDIVEWQPLRIASAPGLIYLGLSGFALATLWRSRAESRPALVAALVALVLLPLTAVRHLQLFAIGMPVLLADHFAAVWRRKEPAPRAAVRDRAIVIGVTVVACAALVGTAVRAATCIRIDPDRAIPFPVRAVAWIEASGISGNMATYFDWGEYAIWHLAPDIRVSMDGRRETVYPDSIRREYLRFQSGLEGWRALLERPRTDLVLFSSAWPGYQLVRLDPAWEPVYEDGLAGVFVRTGDPLGDRLRATPVPELSVTGAGSCAP